VLCLSQPANLARLARAPIEAIGFWRLLLAAAALAPWALATLRGRRPRPRALALSALCGVLFFAHLWTFIYAALHTKVANCMILFSVHPVLTAAGARLFYGERVRGRLAVAYLLAAAGVGVLVRGSAGLDPALLRGDLSALGSAACFTAYVLAGRSAREEVPNELFACLVYALAGGLFLATALLRGVPLSGYPAATWLAVAGLAFGVTLVGHAGFTSLYGRFSLAFLSCAKLVEPVLGALTASVIFREGLSGRAAAAFALAGAAVVLLATVPAEEGG